jgi:hypothetical protein
MSRYRGLFLFVLFALLLSTLILRSGEAQKGKNKPKPITVEPINPAESAGQTRNSGPAPISAQAVNFAESAPLSQIASQASGSESDRKEGEEEEAAENRAVHHPTAEALAKAQHMTAAEALNRDGALQRNAPAPNIPVPSLTFEGLSFQDNLNAGFGLLSPPDTNGAVGRNHYVQQTNLLVRVWDKSGNPLTAPFKLSGLFAPLGGQCAAPDRGDPVVLYDAISDRWILSQFAFIALNTPPYHQCIAVSKNGDPTGSYFLYDFVTAGVEFPDYPKVGVWPDGYYMMVHQFTNGGPFNGTGFYAFNRAKMILGDPTANYIYFNFNLASHPEGVGGSLPSTVDGLNLPPPGRPNTFAYFTTTDFGDPANGIRLFDFHADFAIPANSTFTERSESTYAAPLAVAPFSVITPASRRAVPQPAPASGVTMALDAITDRFMHRMQYRNRGGFETLVMTHNVGAPASATFGTFRAAPRYYELRRALPAGSFTVNEQATFAPADGVSRWMASASEDGQGNLAVGYSVSSATVFPGISYAGRLATDPPGGLAQGETSLIAGTGAQRSTGNRWGDYSALTVDPSDDCTFWYTDEYYTLAGQTASTVGWQTRIGKFKFTQCNAPAMGTLSGTVTFCENGVPISGAIVQVSDGHSGTTLANGTYSIPLAPGSYTVTVSAGSQSCTTSSSFPVTITDGVTTTLNTCLNGAPKPAVTGTAISGGNGDGVINVNECNNLNVTLSNSGCNSLTGVSTTLSTSTPNVTITQPSSPYSDLAIGGSGVNTVPYNISTSSSFVCGTTINFTLTVNSTQGPFVLNFSLPTCQAPNQNISGSIAAGDPTQTGRLFRDGVATVCGTPKATPTVVDAVLRRYDTYTFTNTSNGTACVTASITSGCGTNIFYATYLGSFNPANIQQNYLADPGASFAGAATWSFNVPAGQTFVIVVHEVAVTGCASYTGTISGLLSSANGGATCESLSAAAKRSSWTSAGSTGALDEDSAGKLTYQDFTTRFAAAQTGTATVRYNITAVNGISAFCPASQSTISVRYRNGDPTGVTSRVKFEIHRTNITTGGNSIIYTFSSDGLPGGSAFHTFSTAQPGLDFDFANNIYWIEATIFRSDPSQFADLGSIEIFESAGTTCP